MHYQVLARKWRPQKFEELIGQPHIVRTLKNSLEQKRIAQAYLLAGTRGVGKTTVARIFAKSIRCEDLQDNATPCGKCEPCIENSNQSSMDVIEIDGASHNGVESIRTLIDNVQYLPTSGQYKVYIIDEVHMLSVSAFNALLKTLEEPPAHVIFIFATTDPDKLLKTVISRCQRLDFRNVQDQDLTEHIEMISQKEGIKFESPALVSDLCSLGKGSVRDTLSLLDQLLSMSEDKFISEEVFSLSLGVAKDSEVEQMIQFIAEEKPSELKDLFLKIFRNNIDIKAFCSQVNTKLFNLTQSESQRSKFNIALDESFWLFEAFGREMIWVFDSLSPLETVLAVFQKLSLRGAFFSPSEKKKPIVSIQKQKQDLSQDPDKLATSVEVEVEVEAESETYTENNKKLNKQVSFTWKDFLASMESKSLALTQNLRRALLANEDKIQQGECHLDILYVEGDEVLYNFVVDSETRSKLQLYLREYLETEDANSTWSMSFKIITRTEKKELGIVSIEEEIENLYQKEQELKKESVKNNPYVLEAQKLFDAQVDKIIIKE